MKQWRDILFQIHAEHLPSSRLLVSALELHATALMTKFPWYWTHVGPLCLLWIAIHIGRRPWLYVYFTVRDILLCRRFKPIDAYKRTSPHGPETKHLRPRCTPMDGVYAAGRLSSHSPFQQMYIRAAAQRSLSGMPMLVDAPNRSCRERLCLYMLQIVY